MQRDSASADFSKRKPTESLMRENPNAGTTKEKEDERKKDRNAVLEGHSHGRVYLKKKEEGSWSQPQVLNRPGGGGKDSATVIV